MAARQRLVDAFELGYGRAALYDAERWDHRLEAVVAELGPGIVDELVELIAFYSQPTSGITRPWSLAWYVRWAEALRRQRTAGKRRQRGIDRWRRRAAHGGYLAEFEDELLRAEEAERYGRWLCVRRAAARARARAEEQGYARPYGELGDRTRERAVRGFDPRWQMAPGRRRFTYRPGLA
jgi:hypothetical protein